MGIPMDDIHTHTVPAGPVSGKSSASVNLSKTGLTQLFDDKEKLEAELKTLSDVLGSHGVDMNTSLLTEDWFPRADLDIAQIRTTRARIIRLRNDYKAVMLKVEEGIAAYFASVKDTEGNTSAPLSIRPSANRDVEGASGTQVETLEMPFAKVNSVTEGSPAAKAGLKAGDKVCNFGNITWANHENLTKIAAVVTNNIELPILVKVTRSSSDGESTQLTLRLTPSNDWGGRGLLGCHLVPL
ncbi:putative 26S proteasome regulatory subunit [Microsporum audouinii]